MTRCASNGQPVRRGELRRPDRDRLPRVDFVELSRYSSAPPVASTSATPNHGCVLSLVTTKSCPDRRTVATRNTKPS